MSSENVWHADLYDDKLSFISNYGKEIVTMLQPKKAEQILDVGCGTGVLTYEISKSGATVTGIDASTEMIQKAQTKFPNLVFEIENAESFRTVQKYDAVFSNAALHWMKRADKVVESISLSLRDGGRFVAEFGGIGNVQTVIQGISNVLWNEYEIQADTRNPWYLPSIGEYSSLLEKNGFTVTYAHLFDRPTRLSDGEEGMNHWLESFADDFFPELSREKRKVAFEKVKNELKSDLLKNGEWEVDYKRIRIVAVKKEMRV